MTIEAPTVIAEVEPEATPVPQFGLIVTGSPSIESEELVYSSLDKMTRHRQPTLVLSGGNKGPDLIGGAWALAKNLHVMWFYPEFSRYGAWARAQSNWEMGALASRLNGGLVAFWDGKSRDTQHMIQAARSLDLSVRIVRTDEAK